MKEKDGDTIKTLYEANKADFKLYTIFVDTKNDDGDYIFWKLHDKKYSEQFSTLSTLENPYQTNAGVSYDGLASSEEEDLSGGSVFTTPTTLLFDSKFAEEDYGVKGYWCSDDGIGKYGISEIIFDIADKEGQATGTPLAKARTIWDCWNHIGTFDNSDDKNIIIE